MAMSDALLEFIESRIDYALCTIGTHAEKLEEHENPLVRHHRYHNIVELMRMVESHAKR